MDGERSAWRRVDRSAEPVVVALIDTGLDAEHPELAGRLWRNPGEMPGNGVDDDGNGLADDVIGWDFAGNGDRPRDRDGQGTRVAGVIAARWDGAGIAGVDPFARLMVLKARERAGEARPAEVAAAVRYAADHGARVVRLDAPEAGFGDAEGRALDYAAERGVLLVVAAGDAGRDVGDLGLAGLGAVVTVAATRPDDARAHFSGFGRAVDLAAPGLDVLTLCAGPAGPHCRASGTALSAAVVAGTASLLFAARPALTAHDARRVLLHSARDLGAPGVDPETGYGLLDARAALGADARFFVEAAIERVERAGDALRVVGRADANAFEGAALELGAGEAPERWEPLAKIRRPVRGGVLGSFPPDLLAGPGPWTLRLVARHKGGWAREARHPVERLEAPRRASDF